MAPTSRTSFPLRMWRASILHADTYEEVEADRGSIGQAFAIVLMASSAGALGTWIRVATGTPLPENALPGTVVSRPGPRVHVEDLVAVVGLRG